MHNKVVYVKSNFLIEEIAAKRSMPIGHDKDIEQEVDEFLEVCPEEKRDRVRCRIISRRQKEKENYDRGVAEQFSQEPKIDGEKLNNDIASAIAILNSEGYEVTTIVPVISGAYDKDVSCEHGGDWGYAYGYGYGYSYTEGVSIIARKINQS